MYHSETKLNFEVNLISSCKSGDDYFALEKRKESKFSDQKNGLRKKVFISLGCRVTMISRAYSVTRFGNVL